MESWSLQDAKAKFSEFVRLVKSKGPHVVTVRGKPEVVVMTIKDYEALQQQRPSLLMLMKSSPLANMDLEVERSGTSREFDL
ncbi:MAG: type II toxin-antitoxin system Phd/YefM family antitoxin [Alphaproteobacteria bacterium]|nr:type II toxin-antitoxin system Phd/YefM family antitoxin [Alphaproteobacteria bacterium]